MKKISKKETLELKKSSQESFLNKFFNLSERNSSVVLEFIAGLTAGLIVLFTLNTSANLLSNAMGGEQPQYFGILLILGLIVSGIFSIIGGIYTKLPVVFSSFLGFTSFLTVSLISILSLGWNVALSVFLVEGAIFIVIAFTPLRKWVITEIPSFMSFAAPFALGGILVFFSLISGKFISFKGDSQIVSFTLRNSETFVFIIGTIITFVLFKERVRGFLLYGIAITALLSMILPRVASFNLRQAVIILSSLVVGWLLFYAFLVDAKRKYSLEISLGVLIVAMIIVLIFFRNPDAIVVPPSKLIGEGGIFALPTLKNMSLVLSKPVLSVGDVFKKFGLLFVPLVSLLFTHVITMIALLKSVWLLFEEIQVTEKEKKVLNGRILVTEGGGTFLSGGFGCSPISSSFGTLVSLISGGKTGLTSIFAGIVVILSLFIIPLSSRVFTPFIVAPALFVVGLSLITKGLLIQNEERKENIIPLLITGLVSAFTLNIFQGIAGGFLFYVIVKLISGKSKEINVFTWILFFLFVLFGFFRINIPFFD